MIWHFSASVLWTALSVFHNRVIIIVQDCAAQAGDSEPVEDKCVYYELCPPHFIQPQCPFPIQPLLGPSMLCDRAWQILDFLGVWCWY